MGWETAQEERKEYADSEKAAFRVPCVESNRGERGNEYTHYPNRDADSGDRGGAGRYEASAVAGRT